MPVSSRPEVVPVTPVLKARFILYGFSLVLCVVLAGIGGRLTDLQVGSYSIMLMVVGVTGIVAISNVFLIMNTALHTTRLKPGIALSYFIVAAHVILQLLQMVAAALIIKNSSSVTCSDHVPQTVQGNSGQTEPAPVYPTTICRMHFAYFILIFLSFGCTCISLALCVYQDDDLRKSMRGLWRRLLGRSEGKTRETTPLPRHARLPNANKLDISRPEIRRSWVAFKSREPRPAPSRASWISWKAREPQPAPPVPPLPPMPSAAYPGVRIGQRLEAARPIRDYEASASAPHALRMPPPTYAGPASPVPVSGGRRPRPPPLDLTSPTKPLSERARRQADYSRARADYRNKI